MPSGLEPKTRELLYKARTEFARDLVVGQLAEPEFALLRGQWHAFFSAALKVAKNQNRYLYNPLLVTFYDDGNGGLTTDHGMQPLRDPGTPPRIRLADVEAFAEELSDLTDTMTDLLGQTSLALRTRRAA